jgi:hypothetical protein
MGSPGAWNGGYNAQSVPYLALQISAHFNMLHETAGTSRTFFQVQLPMFTISILYIAFKSLSNSIEELLFYTHHSILYYLSPQISFSIFNVTMQLFIRIFLVLVAFP